MKYIKNEMIKPILIGGVVVGVIKGAINGLFFVIPIIGNLSCCCCLLYVLSGVITAHLMTGKYIPSDSDYMISGALSGIIAVLINSLLGLLIGIIYGATALFNVLSMGGYHSGLSMLLGSMLFGSLALIYSIISIIISIILGAILGAIGGILYGKLRNN